MSREEDEVGGSGKTQERRPLAGSVELPRSLLIRRRPAGTVGKRRSERGSRRVDVNERDAPLTLC